MSVLLLVPIEWRSHRMGTPSGLPAAGRSPRPLRYAFSALVALLPLPLSLAYCGGGELRAASVVRLIAVVVVARCVGFSDALRHCIG
jgi:hypothetical protein